jgi:molecular chaperone HtpG
MFEDAILRLQQTGLFKKILEKEDEEIKKTSLEDHEISQNIISVVRKAAPLLERVPENMPEFTLHNANHSIHVIENMDRIIPRETLKQLNIIEISIFIYAAYLHDIGMVSSSDERKQIVKTSEFKNLLIFNEEFYEQFEEAKNNADYETASDIENKIFTNYLRINHVERAHKIIEKYNLDSKISWKDVSYYQWVRSVCESHELPVKDLYNIKSWPNDTFVLDKPVNIQYLAVIFRLADILDIDPERTPKHLFYYINPNDEISIKEWKKHLSITGFQITSEKIKIVADCKHPEQERTLRKFIKTIDKEIEDSYRLVSNYRDNLEEKYTLKLSDSIDKEIHSIGYEYCDFCFELDYRRVLDLLMGERFYGDPIVALRELLQNSVDAVRYRESLEKREGNGYTPSIEVSLKNDELIVEDNGIGMDEGIFENYFMKVGRSYYQSLNFRQKNLDIDPVSEFGIGILSVFMVASKFTVESKRKTFEDELSPSKPIYFEIPTAYDYFVKRQSKRSKPGTKITLCLKPNHPFSAETLMETISKIAPFIEYQIRIHTTNGKKDISLFCQEESRIILVTQKNILKSHLIM